ncbi:MAG: hypothetical protein E7L17_07355 [Clostridium sp.]|uniref:hypothetical protein n=1 Tax=Clostridium sp. TaxID=1506 RepID=UPI0029118DF0|nr:hypothetical protein [Clostridium sp.]MDU7337913.1 hypothetical protein [Clostridium sp.]
MLERFRRAMYGRYGGDQLMVGSLILYMLLIMLSRLINFYPLTLVAYLIFGWSMFRILSRNLPRRYAENQLFLKYWNKVTAWFHSKQKYVQDHKVYRYFKCPKCTTRLRVPKGRGKIEVTCPVCKAQFIRKS